MEHLNKALSLYHSGDAENQLPAALDPTAQEERQKTMRSYTATAMLLQADRDIETLLRMRIPAGLVFERQHKEEYDASTLRYKGWINDKSRLLRDLQLRYIAVIKLKAGAAGVAAAGRIGQLFLDFAEDLSNAPIPPEPQAPNYLSEGVWSGRFADAFCGSQKHAAQPLIKKAVEGFTACLKKAHDLNLDGPLVERCETGLQTLGEPLPVLAVARD
jgi:hypothetical protein